MPKQIITRGPVQLREFVPADLEASGRHERTYPVSRVRVVERGPDVELQVHVRAIRSGVLVIPATDEREVLQRLFGEVAAPTPVTREDRSAFQLLLQGFEDAVLSGDVERLRAAWQRVMAAFDTMARDLETLSGLPSAAPDAARGAA